ncbi:MAG: DUF3373 family protein [Thermodesulfobacteriota bacterium]|nr:DUF3373 family protein [Thermodesulfobacteriota bacterium]
MVKRGITYLLLGFIIGFLMIPLTAEASNHEDLRLMEEDITELSGRLDKVETKSILDRVVIGGEFRTRMDYIRYKDTMESGIKDDANTEDVWSNRLRLNLKADITDDLVFHGRLTCFKLWGESNFIGYERDMYHPSIPDSEGNLHVERAYVDYAIPDLQISFTIGRLPTNEGPPAELRENRTRKATYPKLLVDAELDGIFLNIYLDQFTDLKKSVLRFVYPKLFQNYQKYRGIEIKDTSAPSVTFESQVPNIENSLLWLSYTKLLSLATFTELPAEYEALGYRITSPAEDFGELTFYTLHIQFDDINKDGLDWFLSFIYGEIDASSEGSTVTTPFGSYEIGIFGDSINGNLGESRSFSGFYTGLRYKLPIKRWKNPKIGFEYNHGSKYFAGLAGMGSGYLINKLLIHGDAYELYYIQPIDNKRMFLRMGGVYIDHDYYNRLVAYGSVSKSDMTITNVYLLLDVLF